MIVPVSTEKQIETVESLAREIWTEHYTPIIGRAQVEYMLDKIQSREAIARQIAEMYRYFLIRKDNCDIGYVAVQPREDELFLSKIYVLDQERGRGYGWEGFTFVEHIAKKEGFAVITLTVNKNNTNSIKTYKKWGFKKLFALVQDIGGGFIMDDYKMGKTIRS